MSEGGWSNGAIFENYLTTHFTANVGITNHPNQDPILCLMDIVPISKQHVILFFLPPHSSHLTQPLDVGIFERIFTTESVLFSGKYNKNSNMKILETANS